MENSETDPLKAELLKTLSAMIEDIGSSRQVIAKRLGVLGPDITAIQNSDGRRFSVERIRRLLERLGQELKVEIVPQSASEQFNLASIGLPQLAPLTESTGPGLVLIGGLARHGQELVLNALLHEHQLRGARCISYKPAGRNISRASGSNAVSTFNCDLSIEQRARFGYDVISVDAGSPVAVEPWTLLHFAKDSRTYVLMESPFGAEEGQAAVDQLALRMRMPRIADANSHILSALLQVVIVHSTISSSSGDVEFKVSRFRVNSAGSLAAFTDEQTIGILRSGQAPSIFDINGPLLTHESALAFLNAVRHEVGQDFVIVNSDTANRREVEMRILHRDTDASVTVAASWSRSANRYGIVLCSEEPNVPSTRSHPIPQTRILTAPTDVHYVAAFARRFLSRFSPA